MIVGEQKPLGEIQGFLGDARRVLVAGCGTCVTVCLAGGEKEAKLLASALRMATKVEGTPCEVADATVQRQCEWEYLDEIRAQVEEADVIVSLACGIGVQAMVRHFPSKWVVPGVNTTFLGLPEEQGIWTEQCQACGNCMLAVTGGICPIARCSKQLHNGPCGGSENGLCEVKRVRRESGEPIYRTDARGKQVPATEDVECAWHLIYERLKGVGRLGQIMGFQPAKDWSTSRDGGPRRIVREDLLLVDEG
ncbi:MAG: methylenetetrahydrofolate reductase C-terminal domain-containing protein [Deltaproteobacteria bacterium]|nr:methylenetetrahydrofolate reductase C-terminal domain-containing protein [Deltaproteobacteria bacterium]